MSLATLGEMQVLLAPVSKRALKKWGVAFVPGTQVPGGRQARLMTIPFAGENLPLRQGMGEEAEVGHSVADLLNGEFTFSVQFFARSKRIAGGVEKLDDLGIMHQSKFSATRGKKLWQLLHERFIVPPNFGRRIFRRVSHFWSFDHCDD
ncbi:MAG: hypothetical protein WBQ86_08010 [Candidatus Binatus sp.]